MPTLLSDPLHFYDDESILYRTFLTKENNVGEPTVNMVRASYIPELYRSKRQALAYDIF